MEHSNSHLFILDRQKFYFEFFVTLRCLQNSICPLYLLLYYHCFLGESSEMFSCYFWLLYLNLTLQKMLRKTCREENSTLFVKLSYTFLKKCSLYNGNISKETAAVCRIMVLHSWHYPYWACIGYIVNLQ